ncbi:cytochrome P450 2J6-like [Apostichopus japonicus]|uniref:cytochrome P450 2J6-like n=1 Tax=Stichopus japonicus TaxID=307972 RepID=UPI003AB14DB3
MDTERETDSYKKTHHSSLNVFAMMIWPEYFNITTIVVGVVTFCLLAALILRPKNSPPGPWGVPIFGCIPYFIFSRRTGRKIFEDWYHRYGPIYNTKVGAINVVVLNEIEGFKEAFGNPEFQGRLPVDFMLGRAGEGIVMSDGRAWQEQRKFVHQHFRDFGVGKSSFEDSIAAEAEALTDALLKLEGQSVCLEHLINNAVCNVISSVSFGRRFDYDDKSLQTVLEMLKETVESSALQLVLSVLFPITKYIPFGGSNQIRQKVQIYFKFLDKLVSEHKAKLDETNIRDVMDAYLIEMKKDNGNSDIFNDDNMVFTVGDLFGAGTETTTLTLLWIILFLLKNPEAEAKVRAELGRVVGRNRLPRYSDRSNLPYIEAVISESLRLGTVSSVGIPHVASSNSTLQGYFIPKGTLLLPNFHALFTYTGKWEEPEEFRPERFLDKVGNFVRREDFIPFSIGRRQCIGEQLARMEIFIFLTHTMHKFALSVPEGHDPSVEGVGFTHKPQSYNVLIRKCED